METGSTLAVILAAGLGKRMNSAKPKVLHEIGGAPIIDHVLANVLTAKIDTIAVVIGPDEDDLQSHLATAFPDVAICIQQERLGTAHAALAAETLIKQNSGDVLILFGDSPFVSAATINTLRGGLNSGAAVAVGGMEPPDPGAYGRLIMDGDDLVAIREERDASSEEKTIRLCNGGLMALHGDEALALLQSVKNTNAQGEYYLTDCVEIARSRGLKTAVARLDYRDLLGINDRIQLAEAETRFQEERRLHLMRSGVTLRAPETVFVSWDTVIEPDVVVEPNVVLSPGVTIRTGAVVHAFSHIAETEVGPGASVGPYARLRPGTKLGAKSKVGNFCELKNADLGEGAKVNHLSYVGDAIVGEKSNIGAGTITCNYDGFRKFQTAIGAGAFVGSNSALVAPLTIGEGAYVASGSVITEDVSSNALAFGRARQVEKPGRAKTMRETLPGKKT